MALAGSSLMESIRTLLSWEREESRAGSRWVGVGAEEFGVLRQRRWTVDEIACWSAEHERQMWSMTRHGRRTAFGEAA